MKRTIEYSLIALCFAAVVGPATECPAWPTHGVAICNDFSDQLYQRIVSDDHGGAIIAWSDQRHGDHDVFAQRVDRFGNVLWQADGEEICVQSGNQVVYGAAPDGARGAILAWQDHRDGTQIYAQRIDGAGEAQWMDQGVRISGGDLVMTHTAPRVVTDGEGGAIICWQRFDLLNYGVFCQRIDATGTSLLWGTHGVLISNTDLDPRENIAVAPDGTGGIVCSWMRSYFDEANLFASGVDPEGTLRWGELSIATGIDPEPWGFDILEARIMGDGNGGAFLTWAANSNPAPAGYDILAQHVDKRGAKRWASDGVTACGSIHDQYQPRLTTDGAGGVFLCWRHGGLDTVYDIYALRLRADGTSAWVSGIREVCGAEDEQINPEIVSDGAGGAIVLWQDARSGAADIYAQRLGPAGNWLWQPQGVAVCSAVGDQENPIAVAGAAGGIVAAWRDHRSLPADLFAQWLDSGGRWSAVEPTIVAVTDQPDDQGGYVSVMVAASRLDGDPAVDEPISMYRLWRRLSQETGQPRSPGLPPGTWESVGTHAATQQTIYGFLVPTRASATSTNEAWEVFVATAHTANPIDFFPSAPDSGFAVDNLAPASPEGFTGEQQYAPLGLRLTWFASQETDLAHYAVYRDVTEDFVPGLQNLLTVTADTTAFDDEWPQNGNFFYKLSAMDVHENESDHALLRPDEVTGIGETDLPPRTYLAPIYPNPFNPQTKISFELARTGKVRIAVYTLTGHCVTDLVDRRFEAGTHVLSWNGRDSAHRGVPSGVYLVRLEAGSSTHSRKVMLIR